MIIILTKMLFISIEDHHKSEISLFFDDFFFYNISCVFIYNSFDYMTVIKCFLKIRNFLSDSIKSNFRTFISV